MQVFTSMKSSVKVSLLRVIDLFLCHQQTCPELVTMLLKFTGLCIILVFLLTNGAAISDFSSGV